MKINLYRGQIFYIVVKLWLMRLKSDLCFKPNLPADTFPDFC